MFFLRVVVSREKKNSLVIKAITNSIVWLIQASNSSNDSILKAMADTLFEQKKIERAKDRIFRGQL